jgi:V8-like Glu-specific endopeptidase
MRKKFGPVLGVILVAACTVPAEEPETRETPIIAGTANPGDPAIVELFAIGKNSVAKCTTTLISPRVLITAAHCIFDTKGARYGVFLGNDDRKVTGKDLLPVTTALYDPMYNTDPGNGHDLAVVVLATPLTLAPVPVNRAPLPASTVGKDARYVGYGLTNGVTATGDGIKRMATAPLAQVTGQLIRIATNPHGTCHGDSGGPLLMDNGGGEAIIGIVSFGDDATCRKNSYFQRVDTQVAWVDQQIKKYDPGTTIPEAGAGGSDASVTADARPADAAGPADALPGPADAAAGQPPPVFIPPAEHRDAAVALPPAHAGDAGRAEGGPDAAASADEGEYTQAVAGSACAIAPARAPAQGPALAAAGLLASVALARRSRRRRAERR